MPPCTCNSGPQTLLVVLDLNGTVLESTHKFRRGHVYDARARAKYVYFRPFMHDFFAALFDDPRIEVAIWSSNKLDNVYATLQTFLSDSQMAQLAFVFSGSECTWRPNYKSVKSLDVLWRNGCCRAHTTIVDDSDDKIEPSNSPNWYKIDTFSMLNDDHVTRNDTCLLRLLDDLRATLDACGLSWSEQ